jgi:uncharacterized iron-regulated protein
MNFSHFKFLMILLCLSNFIKAQLSDNHYFIYSVKEQKTIDIKTLIADMKSIDVLFFGEEHNDSVAHYLESEIFKTLHSNYPNTALSMEMFDRDVQPIMNEYLKDYIKEKHFKKDARVWNNYRDYRPMVEYAKTNKLDVICANAAGRYSNLVGRKGQKALLELPLESKKYFAPLPYDTASGGYFNKLMGLTGHSASSKTDTAQKKAMPAMMGGFNLIMAQSLWDATMAYSITEYQKTKKNAKIFHVNGRFHSDEYFAVVTQLKKYNPKTTYLTISCGSEDNFPNINWEELKNLGDYIIITDPKVPKTYNE